MQEEEVHGSMDITANHSAGGCGGVMESASLSSGVSSPSTSHYNNELGDLYYNDDNNKNNVNMKNDTTTQVGILIHDMTINNDDDDDEVVMKYYNDTTMNNIESEIFDSRHKSNVYKMILFVNIIGYFVVTQSNFFPMNLIPFFPKMDFLNNYYSHELLCMWICFGVSYTVATLSTLVSLIRNRNGQHTQPYTEYGDIATNSLLRKKLSTFAILLWSIKLQIMLLFFNQPITINTNTNTSETAENEEVEQQVSMMHNHNSEDDNEQLSMIDWMMFTIACMICLLPYCSGLSSKLSGNKFYTRMGFNTSMLGLIILTIADYQEYLFSKEGNDTNDSLPFCTIGLWKISQNPNLFGNCLFWMGVYVINVTSLVDTTKASSGYRNDPDIDTEYPEEAQNHHSLIHTKLFYYTWSFRRCILATILGPILLSKFVWNQCEYNQQRGFEKYNDTSQEYQNYIDSTPLLIPRLTLSKKLLVSDDYSIQTTMSSSQQPVQNYFNMVHGADTNMMDIHEESVEYQNYYNNNGEEDHYNGSNEDEIMYEYVDATKNENEEIPTDSFDGAAGAIMDEDSNLDSNSSPEVDAVNGDIPVISDEQETNIVETIDYEDVENVDDQITLEDINAAPVLIEGDGNYDIPVPNSDDISEEVHGNNENVRIDSEVNMDEESILLRPKESSPSPPTVEPEYNIIPDLPHIPIPADEDDTRKIPVPNLDISESDDSSGTTVEEHHTDEVIVDTTTTADSTIDEVPMKMVYEEPMIDEVPMVDESVTNESTNQPRISVEPEKEPQIRIIADEPEVPLPVEDDGTGQIPVPNTNFDDEAEAVEDNTYSMSDKEIDPEILDNEETQQYVEGYDDEEQQLVPDTKLDYVIDEVDDDMVAGNLDTKENHNVLQNDPSHDSTSDAFVEVDATVKTNTEAEGTEETSLLSLASDVESGTLENVDTVVSDASTGSDKANVPEKKVSRFHKRTVSHTLDMKPPSMDDDYLDDDENLFTQLIDATSKINLKKIKEAVVDFKKVVLEPEGILNLKSIKQAVFDFKKVMLEPETKNILVDRDEIIQPLPKANVADWLANLEKLAFDEEAR